MSNPVTRFFASKKFAHGLGAIGRFMITSGTVILLLVAYQIWGTNIETSKDQKVLRNQFKQEEARLHRAQATDPPTTTTAPAKGGDDPNISPPATLPARTVADIPAPTADTAIGTITIKSIGLLDFAIIQGTDVPELERGAGHYLSTPLPGQLGNAAIAGHRTTYGAPFHNIDKVKPGDTIVITTLQGTFTYVETGQIIVKPNDSAVLAPGCDGNCGGGATLTLTACHPKFSASKRIVTFAKLVGNPVPELPNQNKVAAQDQKAENAAGGGGGADTGTIDTLGEGPVVHFPGAWWGLGCMALWIVVRLLAWFGHRKKVFSRVIPYVIGTPICLLMLYFFFEAFSYEAFTKAIHLNL